MSITTASQSQLGQQTAKNSQVVTTVTKNYNSGTLGSGPSITSVIVTDSSYNALDDTAVTNSNGYIKIVGTGFTSAANVYIGSSVVPAANVTFVSSTELRARVPVLSVGNYNLSVFNSNSSGAISSSTFIVSSAPVWVTSSPLSNTASNVAFSVSLSATSDSSITYSNTSALPAGTTLLANGYFYGTASPGVTTTYSFNVKATDTELQDTTKTFNLTITVGLAPGIYSWGGSFYGSLGTNDDISRSSPTQVGSTGTWLKIAVKSYHTHAIKNDGTLWTWGSNGNGQLGLNDRVDRSAPTQIGNSTDWADLGTSATDAYGFLAIKTDGTLWACGYNGAGDLGLNDRVNRSSPTQVGAATDWAWLSYGYSNVLAIKTNGTLWGWGAGTLGSFGNGTSTYRSSPVQVGALTTWSKVYGRMYGGFGIRTDGTLWSWGTNQNGSAVGNNSSSETPSMVQLGSDTNWSSGAADNFVCFAIKTTGSLWAWGINSSGNLGTNNTISRSSPVQVGTDTNWSQIRPFSSLGTVAIRTDGTLWTWGNGGNGQLGLNVIAYKSSPTQVGNGTAWSKIGASGSGPHISGILLQS